MDVLGVFRGQGPRNYEAWMRLEELAWSSAEDRYPEVIVLLTRGAESTRCAHKARQDVGELLVVAGGREPTRSGCCRHSLWR
jgi:hypothetical protein